jgi:YHS domain-containing protein
VNKLKQTNAKLRNQNKEYKRIIHELKSKFDNTSMKKRVCKEVNIKIEPTVDLNTEQKEVIDLVDDGVVILDNNTQPKSSASEFACSGLSSEEALCPLPNIVYEIIDVLDEEAIKDDILGDEVETNEETVDEETDNDEEDETKEEVEVVDEEAGEADEDEDEEVFEITIHGKKYYTTNETDGVIYSITDDNDIGDKVGVFKNKNPEFLVNTISKLVEKKMEVEAEVSNIEEIETEEEVFEVTIHGKKYYTSNETDGIIYSITDEGEIGDEVGNFVKGVAIMKK